MNALAELAAFAGVIAVGQFSPGPDMLLLTRTALAKGGRAGTWTAAGISCGLTLHAAVAMGGVSLLLVGETLVARGLRVGAGFYLAWLGLGLLASARRGSGVAGAAPDGITGSDALTCWRRGFFCNVLNPKVALFFAAITAPFLTSCHPRWWPWLLGGVIVGQGFGLWAGWGWALQWPPLKRSYQTAAGWIDAVFGLVLLGLAARVIAGSV
ncbi:MAG: hypothetical protein RLZZ522_199 [Verrucomicrobiota bacterium]